VLKLISTHVCLIGILIFSFNEKIFHLSYLAFENLDYLVYMKNKVTDFKTHRKNTSEIDKVILNNGSSYLVVDGYWSITGLEDDKNTNKKEAFLGVPPALYTKKPDHALYLGVGTGISVGATSLLFNRVTAVEISPLFLNLLPDFSNQNFNLHEQEKVNFVIDDGLNYLYRNNVKFDAIVNNVPHPQHFSGSKLWTVSAYKKISQSLKPGGVYSQWIIGSFGPEGVKIVAKTLFEVFEYCNIFILSKGYYQFTCSLSPLELNTNIKWPKTLTAHLPEAVASADEFVNAVSFPISKKYMKSLNASINTIDHPIFDFTVPRSFKVGQRQPPWYVLSLLDLNLKSYVNKPDILSRNLRRKRCAVINEWAYPSSSEDICEALPVSDDTK